MTLNRLLKYRALRTVAAVWRSWDMHQLCHERLTLPANRFRWGVLLS